MGERAKGAMILLIGWGVMLLGYQVWLVIHTHGQVRWDGMCTVLAVLFGLSFIGGMIAIYFDYRAFMKDLNR
jgi:hypothetical protein